MPEFTWCNGNGFKGCVCIHQFVAVVSCVAFVVCSDDAATIVAVAVAVPLCIVHCMYDARTQRLHLVQWQWLQMQGLCVYACVCRCRELRGFCGVQ